MLASSGTRISGDECLDSFNLKPITISVINDRSNAAETGNIAPYIVPPKMPAIAGPKIKPRLADTAIFPKLLLRLSSDDMSARYALATEIFPPESPSMARARNNTSNGRLITIVPRIALSRLSV
jgi:hypothetical protein